MTDVLQTAKVLHASGIATIPTNADKIPSISSWKKFQTELPSDTDLTRWFSRPDARMALIAGHVQCLDFDEKYAKGILSRFSARSEDVGLDYVLGELLRQRTPSGGFHLVWKCDGKRIGNTKLASRPATESEKLKNPHVREFSMIETRGDGGYFLIAPSAGYVLEQGDWSSIPTITEDDRDALLSLARSFDERQAVEAHPEPARQVGEAAPDATPGDDYDFRADIPALLKQHGWKQAGSSGKYWTRPGKNKGISASWDVVPGRLFVFSSSTQFDPQHVYRPWHVYAMLECGGDYAKAAGELRRQGFGGVTPKKSTQPLPADWNPPIETIPGDPPGVEGVDPTGLAPTSETIEDKIRRMLKTRAFDPTKTPPPLRPIFTLGGVVICTPGNLTAITAQAKVGKSALVQALAAAAMTDAEVDCLTAAGYNESGKAFLYFDTEQSPDDFWHSVNRARTRSGLSEIPKWLHAYTIADIPATYGRKALSIAMADFAEMHGGIHAVILDGAADLVLDVNDAEECNGFVAELHALAIRYDCSIICVIHFNPGSDKVRGHLGSQIERKAESNLILEKNDEVTVIFSVKQRRAPLDKKTGPRFRWDENLKMHVTTEGGFVDRVSLKKVELHDLAIEAFNGAPIMTFTALESAIVRARNVTESTAKRRIAEMRKSKVLAVDSKGFYTIIPPDFPA